MEGIPMSMEGPRCRFAAAIRILFSAVIFLAAVSAAGAQELSKTDTGWSDQAEFSYVETSGNTDTTSFAGRNLLTYRHAPGTAGSWKIGGLHSEEGGRTTAERFETEFRFDWRYTKRIYGYVLAGWSKDRFAGIDHRYYAGSGAGYRLLDGPRHFLAAEAGFNLTREDYINGEGNDFLTGRAFTKYEYAITEKNRFSQSLEFLYDFSDPSHFRVNSETALVASLTDIFSLKAGYAVRYDNEPIPAGLEKTDTILSMTLVVNL
jgi:putative salt-induced outer membrane protein